MNAAFLLASDAAASPGPLELSITSMLVKYGFAAGAALLVLIVGFPLTAWFTGWVIRRWAARGLDPSLHHFLGALLLWTLRIGLFVMVGSMAGLEVSAFVALLGGFAFAVGLALQGHLSNFAGGILIIILRPFRVGDVVEAQGFTAKVSEIRVFNTVLKSQDNRTIILPNGALSNGSIVNFTLEPMRRVDVAVGVSYGTDVARAREVALRAVMVEGRVLRDPAPEVRVSSLADSSVNLSVRAWAPTESYWEVHSSLQERVKAAFDEEGIEIPFPQRVVHMARAPGK